MQYIQSFMLSIMLYQLSNKCVLIHIQLSKDVELGMEKKMGKMRLIFHSVNGTQIQPLHNQHYTD